MSEPRAPDAVHGSPLVAGRAEGPVVALDEPLSFWGGFDSETGLVIDQRHPQVGVSLSGTVVLMHSGRGSSSASSVLAEAVRSGTAPAAIVMVEPDEIVALGAIVAEEIYGRVMPVLVVETDDLERLRAVDRVRIESDGSIGPVPSEGSDG